jgi:transcriptional antiterminator RfaH
MQWYVVSTKPYQENHAALNLESVGVMTFCPKIKQKKTLQGREHAVIAPLFPGYLFAKFDVQSQHRAVTYARGVRKLVSFGSAPATVDDLVVDSIKARLNDGCLVLPEPLFEHGQVVRIQSGPLQGLEAVFERQMSDQQRAVLLLKALAYQVRLVVPLRQVSNGEAVTGE